MTLTRNDIIDQLVKECGMTNKNARAFVYAFFDEMVSVLENGFDVKLSGFGKFSLNDKTPRPGRNPKTGEDCIIPARRVVTFKSGGKMKKHIQVKLSKQLGQGKMIVNHL